MLLHLRRRVEERLAQSPRALLSTCGPAKIQSDEFECQARGLLLYMRVPLASDHLFNLEGGGGVVLTTPCWQVRGSARLLPNDAGPAGLNLGADEAKRWFALLEIQPERVHLFAADGSTVETIDIAAE